jgi:hypothetical protein
VNPEDIYDDLCQAGDLAGAVVRLTDAELAMMILYVRRMDGEVARMILQWLEMDAAERFLATQRKTH